MATSSDGRTEMNFHIMGQKNRFKWWKYFVHLDYLKLYRNVFST